MLFYFLILKEMIMKNLMSIGIFISIIGLSGCATLFGENNKTVQVNSIPEGAQVYMNGSLIGTTPTTLSIPSTFSPPPIAIRKKGYQQQTAQIDTTFQPVGALNILFLPGFIIDAATGDMMKISPESRSINVNLIS
jgi:hypothetical protein